MEYHIFEELALLCKNSLVQEINSPELYVELNFINQPEEQELFFKLDDKTLPANIILDTKINNLQFPFADYFSIEKINQATSFKLQISFNFAAWNKSIALNEFVLNFVANASKHRLSLEIVHMDDHGYSLELNQPKDNAFSIGGELEILSTNLSRVFEQSLLQH